MLCNRLNGNTLVVDVAPFAETSPKTLEEELHDALYFDPPHLDLKNAEQLFSAACDQSKC